MLLDCKKVKATDVIIETRKLLEVLYHGRCVLKSEFFPEKYLVFKTYFEHLWGSYSKILAPENKVDSLLNVLVQAGADDI